MDLSGNDLDNVTRTIMAEAGVNATPASQAAVASVILNRMASGNTRLYGGPSASDIAHHPNAFEPWNPGSGNDPRRFPANSRRDQLKSRCPAALTLPPQGVKTCALALCCRALGGM